MNSTSTTRRKSTVGVGDKKRPSTTISQSLVGSIFAEKQAENNPLVRIRGTDEILTWFRLAGSDDSAALNGEERDMEVTKNKVSIWKLLSFSSRKERFLMAFGIGCSFLAGCGIPVWLALLANALDVFSNLGRLINVVGDTGGLMDALQSELLRLSTAFMIVGAVVFVSGTLYVAIWTYTGEKQALRMQKAFVKSAFNQDAAWFDKHDRDELPTKMGTNIVHMSSAIGRAVADTFGLGVSALGCLVVALILNAALALVMLAIIPLVIIIMMIFNYYIRKSSKAANGELAMAGSVATEAISGIKTVAALCAKLHFGEKYTNHLNESEKYAIKSGVLQSVLAGIVGMTFYFTYCYAFYLGTKQVIERATFQTFLQCFFNSNPNDPECSISGATVMCTIYGVILCVTFIGLMVPGLTTINLGRQAAVPIFATIERVPPINPSSKAGRKLENVEGNLSFKDISFSYPTQPERPIFYDFNLKVQAGQSIALVGPSGSGKSTIARFLLRFYEPGQGQVLIDGVPLTELNLAWWRSKVGYVEQEPRLFPGTIRENIAFGKGGIIRADGKVGPGECTEDEIVDAAKAAYAHDFIMELPDGYDTYYGGTGVQLSGGQMQSKLSWRVNWNSNPFNITHSLTCFYTFVGIAIARAIIRKPVLLVLDEATSALDSTSERHVTAAIANVRKARKMTTVSIAHRLSTIVDSDLIAVLDRGKVQELGDHKTLYNKNGIYTLLCET
jgi:ATP-binding cassette subfamily B (MDR/TAP) protein 1